MSTPAAHEKMKRLLKAWLVARPDLECWQGFHRSLHPSHFSSSTIFVSSFFLNQF